jgi:3-hydroxyacyl-[acyl-carrier-protein] dehydratase
VKPGALQLQFAPDHPAAQGHFPGNPVIPGAVLLNEALVAIGQRLGAPLSGCTIRSAKFLHPVRPGDAVDIEFSESDGRVELTGRLGETTVMKGEVRWSRSATPS